MGVSATDLQLAVVSVLMSFYFDTDLTVMWPHGILIPSPKESMNI